MTEVAPGRLRVVSSDGGRGAPRVVLVHGSMDGAASFRALAEGLDGCTVLRYDRRGYGGSREAEPGGVPFAAHVEDLLDVLDEAPAVVVGHSLGGAIALAASARAPERVRAAVVYEVPMPWLPWWPPVSLPAPGAGPEEVRDVAERFLRRHMGDQRWAALPAPARSELLAAAPAWGAELRSATDDRPVPFVPHALGLPVVSVHGTATDERHRRSAELLAREIPGARLARIPGAGHRAHRSHPASLAELVRPLIA